MSSRFVFYNTSFTQTECGNYVITWNSDIGSDKACSSLSCSSLTHSVLFLSVITKSFLGNKTLLLRKFLFVGCSQLQQNLSGKTSHLFVNTNLISVGLNKKETPNLSGFVIRLIPKNEICLILGSPDAIVPLLRLPTGLWGQIFHQWGVLLKTS